MLSLLRASLVPNKVMLLLQGVASSAQIDSILGFEVDSTEGLPFLESKVSADLEPGKMG